MCMSIVVCQFESHDFEFAGYSGRLLNVSNEGYEAGNVRTMDYMDRSARPRVHHGLKISVISWRHPRCFEIGSPQPSDSETQSLLMRQIAAIHLLAPCMHIGDSKVSVIE